MLKLVKDTPLENHCKVLSVLVQEGETVVRKVAGLCAVSGKAAYHGCKHRAANEHTKAGCRHIHLAQRAGQVIPQCISKAALLEALKDELVFLKSAAEQIAQDAEDDA